MNNRRKISLYIMVVFYVAAGANHFFNPIFYKKIMPPWLPWHYPMIYISGVAEIVLGILLIPAQTRSIAAWGIIALLIAVLPANVQMMLNYIEQGNSYLWVAVIRLPLQLLLISWAYQFTKRIRNRE